MFDQNGLSLDQAPPISVVFGLFLMGAIFGVISGISILYFGHDIFDISSTGAIITVHLLALGFAMSFMLGALFQMLPVVAGVVLESPIPKSNLVKVALALGVVSLIIGFVTNVGLLFLFATIFLGSSLLYVAYTMGSRLLKLSNHSASSRGMIYAIFSLSLLVLLALYMTTAYAQMHSGIYFATIKQMHYSFALFGWVALLIMSISFQTVEMFYVTPAYPKLLGRYAPATVFALLVAASLSLLVNNKLESYIMILVYLLFAIYGTITLIRLSQRKRPLADATVWFWRIGMVSLIISMILLIVHAFISNDTLLEGAIVLFVSFVTSVIFSMFYKIVPFLTWFHLNAQGYFTAPMMHEVIHPTIAKRHMWLHIVMVVSFAFAILIPQMVYLAAVLMMASFLWTTYHIIHAQKLYKYTQENSEKFEMNIG